MMSRDAKWADRVFLFGEKYLKERRGIDESSVIIDNLESVGVNVGDRSHGPMYQFVQSVWRSEPGWIKPACELHVTSTETFQRQSLAIENMTIKEEGKVQITYLGATASNRAFDVRIDLSKTEALQLARALIKSAEDIEKGSV